MVNVIKEVTKVYKTVKTVPGAIAELSGTQLDRLADFARNPERFLRGIFVGWILSAIVSIVSPVFEAVSLMLFGSAPATFAAPYEQWGLVDYPVIIAGGIADGLAALVRLPFSAGSAVIELLVPQVPGPADAVAGTVAVVLVAVVVVRVGLPLLRAALEAVPVVGGPLSTLLGKL